MKWILIIVGIVVLLIAIALIVIWYIARHNTKDKGGMENPYYKEGISSANGEDSTEK